jgi:poly-gamma-glutamate capsule biosynthesis protein CapA/YwtB (metallophosphatase superfamily)
MSHVLTLTGDVNLMNLASPDEPFRLVSPILRQSDFVFSNLECCFYSEKGGRSDETEGFMADPAMGNALKLGGIQAVGLANNVNFGEAAIQASIARLDELGVAHTGAGVGCEAARAPVVLEERGLRVGFLQRTSVYWPTGHEAGERSTGVAVVRAHTAYQLPLHKTRREVPPANRPGIPPVIVTWADPLYLRWLQDDIAALRAKADVVVASCHWGLWEEVLEYMTEIAHAAIDAGADIVIGHGPHYSLPVEVYKGKPVFYGLGSFSFHTGHADGVAVGDWVGMLAQATIDDGRVTNASFRLVRHNDRNETVLCALSNETVAIEGLISRSAVLGSRLRAQGDEVQIDLGA